MKDVEKIEEVKEEVKEKVAKSVEKKVASSDESSSLEVAMGKLQIIDDRVQEAPKEESKEESKSPFDAKLNETLIRSLHQVAMEKRLKCSNPIRDYCHLLSNRLIHHLIGLTDQTSKSQAFFKAVKENLNKMDLSIIPSSDNETLLSHVKSLRASIDKIVKQLKKQLSYQHELKFVKQNNSKMKAAERDISRLEYAYKMLRKNGVDMTEESKFDPVRDIKKIEGQEDTVLITKIFNNYRYEAWHPTLGEFDLANSV